MNDLTRKALAAYYRSGGREWPDESSGPREAEGLQYVVLEKDGKPLAIYRVRSYDGVLRRLRRWPKALNKPDGSS